MSGDETNNKPIAIEDRRKAQEKLLQKLADIADKALGKMGKEDEPEVIEGEVIEVDDTS